MLYLPFKRISSSMSVSANMTVGTREEHLNDFKIIYSSMFWNGYEHTQAFKECNLIKRASKNHPLQNVIQQWTTMRKLLPIIHCMRCQLYEDRGFILDRVRSPFHLSLVAASCIRIRRSNLDFWIFLKNACLTIRKLLYAVPCVCPWLLS